jgi:hypothetical protein
MGKSQLVEESKKPVGAFIDDRNRFLNPEDVQETQEQLKDIERQRLRTQARSNKVSRFLQDSFFRTDKTWPFLFWPVQKLQLSVRMYFPKKNLAIDQFRSPTKTDLAAVDFKRKVLAENGIKYFPMFPQHKLMDLADYL